MRPLPQRRKQARPLLLSALFLLAGLGPSNNAATQSWKAGTATTEITPTRSQWMAGFGARTRPSEGTLHPLYIKVLALEDATGHRAIVLSSDLLGIPQSIYDHIPSTRVLNEDKPRVAPAPRWGYEGNTSMYVYGQPAHRWGDDVEDVIASSVRQLVQQVRPNPAKSR